MDQICSICLSEMSNEQELSTSKYCSCTVKYHKECLEQCYLNNYGCPICKAGAGMNSEPVNISFMTKLILMTLCVCCFFCSPVLYIIMTCFIIYSFIKRPYRDPSIANNQVADIENQIENKAENQIENYVENHELETKNFL